MSDDFIGMIKALRTDLSYEAPQWLPALDAAIASMSEDSANPQKNYRIAISDAIKIGNGFGCVMDVMDWLNDELARIDSMPVAPDADEMAVLRWRLQVSEAHADHLSRILTLRNRSEKRATDLSAKISAKESELHRAVLKMHKADDEHGVGFYGDPTWRDAYEHTRRLVGLEEQ